jgi:curli biogenesis system outer membrane secretion channel CsgG
MRKYVGVLLMLALLAAPALAGDKEPVAVSVNVPMAERPCLAIVSFDDGSLQRQSWWGSGWDVGSGLANILTTTMLDAGRFRLLERSLLEKVTSEQDFGATTRVDASKAAKMGKIIGADYLIMGKVTEFTWETKGGGGLGAIAGGIVGVAASRTKARVCIDVRVVDADTAEILGSYSGKGEESRSKFAIGSSQIGAIAFGSSDFMQSILGLATKKAIDQWETNLCQALDSKKLVLVPKHRAPVRPDGSVLGVEKNTLISNTGSSKGYAVGDAVEIHRKGKVLKDPDTGEVLRVMTELVCKGKIVRVDEKTADIRFDASAKGAPIEGDLVRYAEAR